ncbi:MAG: 2-aminoethylphosphonate aminotransferase [Candidatus Brocadiales bacterium]
MKKRMVLLNPGPINTSERVRNALLRGDICHREDDFYRIQRNVREMLTDTFAHKDTHTAVVFTGSGTSAMEAAVSSSLSEGKTMLVVNNGVYGERMSKIASIYGFNRLELVYEWTRVPDLDEIEATLKGHPGVEVVALVHHETTTGLINPVSEIGELCKRHGKVFLVDTISGIGGEEIDLIKDNVDICMGSANKCIQGLPGLSFVILKKEQIERIKDLPARSMYLHIPTQWENQERDSTPFTPSIPIFYAFEAALEELREEGVAGRIARYKKASGLLREGFKRLGLRLLLPEEHLSNTITALYLPDGTGYQELHDRLKKDGFVIYSGQAQLKEKIFRVANMGELTHEDLNNFLGSLERVLGEVGCRP